MAIAPGFVCVTHFDARVSDVIHSWRPVLLNPSYHPSIRSAEAGSEADSRLRGDGEVRAVVSAHTVEYFHHVAALVGCERRHACAHDTRLDVPTKI